ncbi:MAG: hypothetical protein J6Z27_01015 [Bacteroidales bacterium]|nr:hypothetical protein [Bacteroidales bacterium]
MKKTTFQKVSASEAVCVFGGVDKNVKDLFYQIGYIIGKLISLLFKKTNVVVVR